MKCVAIIASFFVFGVVSGQLCLQETNEMRIREGKVPLTNDDRLVRAAQFHSDWMVANNCFSHQCPGEPGFADRVNQQGYLWWGLGEIIAAGGMANGCRDAVNMWMNSAGHRGILLGNYINLGCAFGTCRNCSFANYYTCLYGVPR